MLAIHDASDVFLEIAKLSKYTGSDVIPSVMFLVFALSWVILRLIYFPSYVIRSTRCTSSVSLVYLLCNESLCRSINMGLILNYLGHVCNVLTWEKVA